MNADAAFPEPSLQLGGGAARIVQRQQFEGVAVEARNRVAASPPRSRLFPEARGLRCRVEGLSVVRPGQGFCRPPGRGNDSPAVVRIDDKCMEAEYARHSVRRNNLLFIKSIRERMREVGWRAGRVPPAGGAAATPFRWERGDWHATGR